MTPKLADYIIEARRFDKPIVVFGISANEDAKPLRRGLRRAVCYL